MICSLCGTRIRLLSLAVVFLLQLKGNEVVIVYASNTAVTTTLLHVVDIVLYSHDNASQHVPLSISFFLFSSVSRIKSLKDSGIAACFETFHGVDFVGCALSIG